LYYASLCGVQRFDNFLFAFEIYNFDKILRQKELCYIYVLIKMDAYKALLYNFEINPAFSQIARESLCQK
jgi:hypothetical protein